MSYEDHEEKPMKGGNPCLRTPVSEYLRLIALGVALFLPWVFIFALPPLQMGIWFNTEGVAFGIAILGSISFLLLLAIGWPWPTLSNHFLIKRAKPRRADTPKWVRSLWRQLSQAHPLLLGVGGLALMSLILLPMAYQYRLSWFGHPEQMIGGWFWLSITGVIFCHLWLKQQEQGNAYNRFIRISIGLACGAQVALVLFAHPRYASGASGQWVLYHFPSHLGWIGVSLLLLSFGEPKRISMVARTLAVVATLLSQNKIAIGGMVLGVPLYLGVAKYTPPKRQWVILLSILLMSPLLLLVIEYTAFSHGALPTLSSRFLSWKVLWEDILQSPVITLFTGMGWGQMSDSIIRQLDLLESSGGQEASWEGIGRFDASSLNQTLDSMAAVGLMGGIFSILIALSPFLREKGYFKHEKFVLKECLDKSFLFAACLMAMLLHHGWFMMISVFPIFISSVMVLNPPNAQGSKIVCGPLKGFGRIPRFCGRIVAGVFALTLLWTGHSIYSTAIFYSSDLNRSLPVRLARTLNGDPLLSCENLVKYQGPGAVNLAFWLKAYRNSQNHLSQEDKKDIGDEIKCALKIVYQIPPFPSLVLLENRKAFLPFE